MGLKKKPKVEVTRYYLSQHFGICLAQLDKLISVFVSEKPVLDSSITDESTVPIDKPDLFGGLKKEGGVGGLMRYMPGGDDQLMPSILAQKLGRSGSADCPGYRGIASLFFYGAGSRGFYWTANAPFVPGVWAKVQRIFKRADGSEQWYPEKAGIEFGGGQSDIDLLAEFPRLSFGDPGYPNPPSFYPGTLTIGPFSQSVQLVAGKRDGSSAGGGDDFLCFNGVRFGDTAAATYGAGTVLYSLPAGETVDIQVENTLSPFSSGLGHMHIVGLDSGILDMNPAHIIHECLTDREYGMGTPLSSIDDASFRAAADTLFAEEFGLSMIWTRQSEIQKFINEVLDHIQAVLFTDPRTGLLVLKLIRDDYDPEDLPVINPDSADLSDFGRKLWGDIVNEIIVTWTNPETEKEETITVQDNASIAVQGGLVSDSRNYYGVRHLELAQRLAYRDLRSAGQPLATAQAVVDRSQYDLVPASVVKLTWPEYDIFDLVMRVQSVDYGKPGDPEIKITMLEDVYGLDIGSYGLPAGSSWIDPAAPPSEMDPVWLITLPYFLAVDSPLAAEITELEYPGVIAGILAGTSNEDTFEHDVLGDVTLSDGSSSQQVISTNNVIGRAELAAPLAREASSTLVDFSNVIGRGSVPTQAGFAIIGDGTEGTDEIALIIADNFDGTYTLARGVLDTVPRSWPAGTSVFFVDESTIFEDSLLRSSGEVLELKLLARTSQGTLSADVASIESTTLTDRPWQPLRPANVEIDGQSFSNAGSPIDQSAAIGNVPVTWANRNRVTEDTQVLQWADASVTPESGQTTTIEIRSLAGTLLITHAGLTGESFDIPLSSFGAETVAEIRIYSERTDSDGTFQSLQYWSEWVSLVSSMRITEDGSGRLTESNDPRMIED